MATPGNRAVRRSTVQGRTPRRSRAQRVCQTPPGVAAVAGVRRSVHAGGIRLPRQDRRAAMVGVAPSAAPPKLGPGRWVIPGHGDVAGGAVVSERRPEAPSFRRDGDGAKHCARIWPAMTMREVLLRAVYRSAIDLLPNAKDKTLTVRLHAVANESSDDAFRYRCAALKPDRATLSKQRAAPRFELVSSHDR